MASGDAIRAVTLASLLLFAGCFGGGSQPTATPARTSTDAPTATGTPTNAPTESPTSTSTPTASPPASTATVTPTPSGSPTGVSVTGGTFPVNATAVFQRVQALMGSDVTPPTVEVRNLTERKGYEPGRALIFRVLGLTNASLDASEPGGVTVTSGKVYLHKGSGDAAAIERVLAHEFVHTVQFRSNALPWLSMLDPPKSTLDWVYARLALTEGPAVFVTSDYVERYVPDARPSSAYVAEKFRQGTPAERLFWARYYFGNRYVESRIDAPAEFARVYEDFPHTTEQVLHNHTRSAEPALNLSVSANESLDAWRTARGTNRIGELILRMALESELDRPTAREAAAGWGNDVLYGFVNGSSAGWALTHRWDSTDDATQFVEAYRTYAQRRAADTPYLYRVVRVTDRTTVAFFGAPPVVENATASGTSTNVTVSVG